MNNFQTTVTDIITIPLLNKHRINENNNKQNNIKNEQVIYTAMVLCLNECFEP